MEMRCIRQLLGITYRDHISNEEVRNRTRQAIEPHDEPLDRSKATQTEMGTVQGGRRRGRQKKRWEDNIPECTGMTLGAAMTKAERREESRELVAKSSVAPQRSTRLRDR
ncbi:hypothetical protein NP493_232g03017 [Ridgeia piscesae]|uniref:Uncharacterized protein n=1 Tax=Ridgeia piscesae TaxID=27915 RepID=A0AAD9NZT7_RIDPI|nr:hypothetical protein NP493_232g03017 [Ridgeia piscesae]